MLAYNRSVDSALDGNLWFSGFPARVGNPHILDGTSFGSYTIYLGVEGFNDLMVICVRDNCRDFRGFTIAEVVIFHCLDTL